jgi:predicted NAD/FAD-binding protein
MQLPEGWEVWTTSPKAYVKNALTVVEQLLQEDGDKYVLKSNVWNPFPTGYKPEIDITDEPVRA